MNEKQPQNVDPIQNYRISLDNYGGIASDLMQVNRTSADKFMQVADVR